MKCPKCNQENPKEALFCMKCGTKLERRCPKCGVEYPEEALFCMKCGTNWWQSRYDDILNYAKMGLEILGDDTECLEAALNNTMLGVTYCNIGKYNEGREYINRNKNFIRKLDYVPELRVPYAHVIMIERDLNSAWEWAKELEMRAEKINDQTGIAEAWYRQGKILQINGDNKNAAIMHKKSIDKYQSIGNNKAPSFSYQSLADILLNSGDILEAEKNAEISLILTEQCGQKLFMSFSYSLLQSISMCQRLWDDAISYYQKYVEIRKDILKDSDNISLQLAWMDFGLGNIYMKKRDYDKALEIFHNFVDKVFEFQDDYAQYRLFQSLEKLEYTYKKIGKYDEFLKFFKDYREKHADSVKALPLKQWYLEPAQINDKLSNLVFSDDFDKDLDPSWTWIDVLNDCHYNITENGIEIHAVNGRDLYGLNMSAPRFVREIKDDFAVQVCISPATKEKPQMGGLFIWKDDKNYVCFERGESDPFGFWFFGYINKEQKMAGRGLLPEESEFTYIRLERIGSEISAYCSIDNENWLTCDKLSFPVDDPIQVGIYTIGMINRTVYCGEYREGGATLFRNFKVWTK